MTDQIDIQNLLAALEDELHASMESRPEPELVQ